MKKVLSLFILTAALVACKKDFLEVDPKSKLSDAQIAGQSEGLVNAAYASLGNDHYTTPWSLWPFDGRSGDAYKGGRDPNDISGFHFLETFKNVRSDFGEVDGWWFQYYTAIGRVNAALRQLNQLPDSDPLKSKRIGEMQFLRGHWYFQLKAMFKYIPYLDENEPINNYENVSNRALSNDELWEKIAADFQGAVDKLPPTQNDIGRPTKYAALAYLAKTRLYQAYKQDDPNKHEVTSIDAAKLNQVVSLVDQVMASPYGLESDYANNFQLTTENGRESVFSVQLSQNNGTQFGTLNFGDVLGTPQGIGCCDFHKPSQNLVNAFRTDANGLPLLTTYNNTNVDLGSNTVDPRLNHTVAMPGHPYKYDAGTIYQENWNRTPDVYGYYASLKENVQKSQYVNMAPFYGNSKNRILIRFADVLLWKAEALIELNRQDEALPIINQIRTRAKNSTGLLKYANGNSEANYKVETYQNGVNINWTQATAREALRFERRLEFAMEGTRFFDLVRWGVAESVMNNYFETEKLRHPYLEEGKFTKNRDEYLPIPFVQIKFSKYQYQQNPGYLQ